MVEVKSDQPKKLVVCSVEDCVDSVMAKGLCRKHYQRNYKYGDPTFVPVRGKDSKPSNPCLVETCENIGATTRGYCSYHYYSFNRYGDPLIRKRSLTPEQLFNDRVEKDQNPEGCWMWTGYNTSSKKNRKGSPYGEIMVGRGRRVAAHRFSYELAFSVKLESHTPVHHKCSNTLCVNPDHLQAVTPEENLAEMLERRYYQSKIKELEGRLRDCTCKNRINKNDSTLLRTTSPLT